MKKKLLKYYILAFCLCSNFVLFAVTEPGSSNGTGTLESGDLSMPSSSDGTGTLESTDPTVPIDNYLWILALVVILYVFFKYRAIHNKRIQS